jgi:hypothetical protein
VILVTKSIVPERGRTRKLYKIKSGSSVFFLQHALLSKESGFEYCTRLGALLVITAHLEQVHQKQYNGTVNMGNVTNSYQGIHQFTMTQVLGLHVVIYNMTLAFQYEEFNNCLFAHHVYELLPVSLFHFSELEG